MLRLHLGREVIPEPHEPKAVGNDDDITQCVVERRNPDVDVAGCGKSESDRREQQGRTDILADDAACLPRKGNEERDVPKIVVHQRNARRIRRDIRSGQAHRYADISRCKNRAVIDAVADDHCRVSSLDEVGEFRVFLLRKALGLDGIDRHQPTDSLCNIQPVASEHRDIPNAVPPHVFNGLRRVGSQLVFKSNRTEVLRTSHQVHARHAGDFLFHRGDGICRGRVEFADPGAATGKNVGTFDMGDDAAAMFLLE